MRRVLCVAVGAARGWSRQGSDAAAWAKDPLLGSTSLPIPVTVSTFAVSLETVKQVSGVFRC